MGVSLRLFFEVRGSTGLVVMIRRFAEAEIRLVGF